MVKLLGYKSGVSGRKQEIWKSSTSCGGLDFAVIITVFTTGQLIYILKVSFEIFILHFDIASFLDTGLCTNSYLTLVKCILKLSCQKPKTVFSKFHLIFRRYCNLKSPKWISWTFILACILLVNFNH